MNQYQPNKMNYHPEEDEDIDTSVRGKTTKTDWEKEFDEIQQEWKKHKTMNTCSICDSPKGHTSIKTFIRTLLSHQREELLAPIREKLPAYLGNHGNWLDLDGILYYLRQEILRSIEKELPKHIKGKNKEFVEGYNNALDDVLFALRLEVNSSK